MAMLVLIVSKGEIGVFRAYALPRWERESLTPMQNPEPPIKGISLITQKNCRWRTDWM